ncbi:hypothetical protein HZY62_16200 [Maribacter polysiphoniae]|uniref:D-glucuronyl C5-epimerase C-terminal domain-containing protein n=1 Tax=Maribacter polysiphoniae TaxID=429344 RepID=A0A316DUG8_9FLAO|nr:hypothetical protein [Maribacter polysiphoniae]MBD1262145.1 hypothetical protein [Maribacter polysiphoniae]PWK21595.1 hypothetical protein LX92_03746 [Maribacter polysiphoniae]
MKIFNRCIVLLLTLSLGLDSCEKASKEHLFDVPDPIDQLGVQRIDSMPNLPKPFKILEFNSLAKDYDKKVYDENQTGEYWPLVWMDNSRKNFDQETYGIYTAMGDVRQGKEHYDGIFHESLASIGSVLGASLVGIDKSNQNDYNYVGMLKNYYNSETNWNIMMNNTGPEVAQLGGGYARDWWYDVYPNVMFFAVADLYPQETENDPILRSVADKFYAADSVLNGNYDYSFFDYATMRPNKTWICTQQDAAAGHAYVLYSAYQKFKDTKYLKGAKSSLEALLNQKENYFYEILMPFGAYVSARMNAEQGTDYDYSEVLDWTFDGNSTCREGWGVLVDNWNGYDVSGLVGSTKHNGGFAFLMNTYDTMWPLVPMVRYDQRYANTIGKWMLNAANASRLFYPYEIPDDHQTIPEEKEHTKGVIAYEGLIKSSHYEEEGLYLDLEAPIAIGDGMKWNKANPKVSQFSVYGSGHVGIAGAIIAKTNVENILQLDLLATDFYRDQAYPSYLYYNPNPEIMEVTISVGSKEVKIYDAVKRAFIAKNVKDSFSFNVDKENSSLLILVPQNTVITEKNGKLYADDTIIDYRYSSSDKKSQ